MRLKNKLLLGMLFAFATTSQAWATNLETHKQIVKEFYEFAINQKDFESASKYLGPQYIQHNPNAEDGAEGFKKYIQWLKENFPNNHGDIKRIFAEGEYVIIHVHSKRTPDTRGLAIIDIFRFENNKIVEHWDVIQEVPEQSKNSNGMF